MRTLLLLLALGAVARADNYMTRAVMIALPASTTTANFVPFSGAFNATTTIGTSSSNAGGAIPRGIVVYRMDCAMDVTPASTATRAFTIQSCATSGCTPADLSPSVTCTTSSGCTGSSTCTCSATSTGSAIPAGSRVVIKIVGGGGAVPAASDGSCEVLFTYQ